MRGRRDARDRIIQGLPEYILLTHECTWRPRHADRCNEAEARVKAAAAEAADARSLRDEALAHARLCEERALEAIRGNAGAGMAQAGRGGAVAGIAAMMRDVDGAVAAAEAESRERERRIMELIHPHGGGGGATGAAAGAAGGLQPPGGAGSVAVVPAVR